MSKEEKNFHFFKELGGKLLTFLVNNQEYGISILQTREVVVLDNIKFVPQCPDYMKGVINLRGSIIPIIDLKKKFNLPETKKKERSICLVTDINKTLTGFLVDQLVGVITVEKNEFEPDPYMGSEINADYLEGMVKRDKKIIIVLNAKNILNLKDLNTIEKNI